MNYVCRAKVCSARYEASGTNNNTSRKVSEQEVLTVIVKMAMKEIPVSWVFGGKNKKLFLY